MGHRLACQVLALMGVVYMSHAAQLRNFARITAWIGPHAIIEVYDRAQLMLDVQLRMAVGRQGIIKVTDGELLTWSDRRFGIAIRICTVHILRPTRTVKQADADLRNSQCDQGSGVRVLRCKPYMRDDFSQNPNKLSPFSIA